MRGGQCITAAIGLARQQAAAFQLHQQPVHAGLGPAADGHGLGQTQRARFAGQNFQQIKQTQTGGGGCCFLHKSQNPRRIQKIFRDFSSFS
jgi:hypothetical protein